MVRPSTVLWSLIITAVLTVLISRWSLHKMRWSLERMADADATSESRAYHLKRFMRHWGHARRSSHIAVAAFFLLFIYSIVGTDDGHEIALNGVYTINMTLALLYWQSLTRVREAVMSAENGGVFLDYILHRISAAEDLVGSALVFNGAVGAAIGVSLVDWKKVQAQLVKQ